MTIEQMENSFEWSFNPLARAVWGDTRFALVVLSNVSNRVGAMPFVNASSAIAYMREQAADGYSSSVFSLDLRITLAWEKPR